MELFRPEYWSGYLFPSPRDPNPKIEPRPLALQAISLLSKPPGKPKNTGVGSLSLLQGNLPYPGIKPGSPALQADSLPAELPGKPLLFVQVTANAQTLPSIHQLPKVRGSLCIFSYCQRCNSQLGCETESPGKFF